MTDASRPGLQSAKDRGRYSRETAIAFAALLALTLILVILIGIAAVDHALAPIDPRNGKARAPGPGGLHTTSSSPGNAPAVQFPSVMNG